MSATYINLKVKGTKSFLTLWVDPKAKEIGGIFYLCSNPDKTSEALNGFAIKNADDEVIATISGHGFRASYDSHELFIAIVDENGERRKLTIYNPDSDTKFKPPVIMEA